MERRRFRETPPRPVGRLADIWLVAIGSRAHIPYESVGDAVVSERTDKITAILLGRAVSASISTLAATGNRVHDQGTASQQQLGATTTALDQVPFIGESVSKPLRDASRSAKEIAAAGTQQHQQTLHVANLVGTSLTVVLIIVLIAIRVRYRGGFIQSASATRHLSSTPTEPSYLPSGRWRPETRPVA